MDFVGEYAANVDAVLKAIWQEERPAIDEAGRMLALFGPDHATRPHPIIL